jgi:predicted amidohydrolase
MHGMPSPADFGFVRVCAAVPVCVPAQPEVNAERIAALAAQAAEDGARLAVFPELALAGYTCGVTRRGSLEVPPGFEPGNDGFADRCLTTWRWHRARS